MTRLAIAGTGRSARLMLLAAAHTPGVQLVGVAAATLGESEELAAFAQVRPLTFDAVPERAEAVVIADEHDTSEVAADLVARGTAVLVAPPIGPTLGGVDRIIAAADASGTPACFGGHLLFAPLIDTAARHRDRLGPIEHLSVILHEPATGDDETCDDSDGRIALERLAPHALSLLLAVLGDLETVGLRCRRDDGAHIEVRLSSGLIAVVDVGYRPDVPQCAVQIAGATGTVRAELAPILGLEIDGRPQDVAATTGDGADERLGDLGYLAMLRGFVGAISRRGGRVCPLGFGRLVLEMQTAATQSASTGSLDEVALPYAGPRDRRV